METPDGEPGLNYLCAGYTTFFQHIDRPMRIMANLLRQGRAPAEIMKTECEGMPKVAFAKANRNDKCPCGSGKKFKYCHGKGKKR